MRLPDGLPVKAGRFRPFRRFLPPAQGVQAAGVFQIPGIFGKLPLFFFHPGKALVIRQPDCVAQPGQAQVGGLLRVQATFNDANGVAEVVNSAPTGVVGDNFQAVPVLANTFVGTAGDAVANGTSALFGPGAHAPFDAVADYRRHVDGRSREDGVAAFLAARGIDVPEGTPQDPAGAWTVHGLAARKNELYLDLLAVRGATAFPGTVDMPALMPLSAEAARWMPQMAPIRAASWAQIVVIRPPASRRVKGRS